jgi:hypothetical protein
MTGAGVGCFIAIVSEEIKPRCAARGDWALRRKIFTNYQTISTTCAAAAHHRTPPPLTRRLWGKVDTLAGCLPAWVIKKRRAVK